MPDYTYVGSELDLFAAAPSGSRTSAARSRPTSAATSWRSARGHGGTTRVFCTPGRATAGSAWSPTPHLAARARERRSTPGSCPPAAGPRRHARRASTGRRPFDTILYMDVLEHIEDDPPSWPAPPSCSAPAGTSSSCRPAHQWLYHAVRRGDRPLSPLQQGQPPRRRPAGAGPRPALLPGRGGHAGLAGQPPAAASRPCPTPRQIAVWDKLHGPRCPAWSTR